MLYLGMCFRVGFQRLWKFIISYSHCDFRGMVLDGVSMCMETSQLQLLCNQASRRLLIVVDEHILALAVDRIISEETTPEPLLT